MNKKHIVLIIAFMGSMLATMAQNVTVLHMKDGTTLRYTNGPKKNTYLDFYKFSPMNTLTPGCTSTHENDFQADWDVNEVWKIGNEYLVGILWTDDVPNNYQAKRGVCLGKKPNLSVGNCDSIEYVVDVDIQTASWGEKSKLSDYALSYSNYFYHNNSTSLNYILIGKTMGNFLISSQYGTISTLKMRMGRDNDSFGILDTLNNRIVTSLEKGQTYYYRTFAEGKVVTGKDTSTVVFYGPERSFRVPYLIEDFGYIPNYQGLQASNKAWAVWMNKNIPGYGYNFIGCNRAFKKWSPSEEIHKEMKSNTEILQFDNGIVNQLNKIPDEFYSWLIHNESSVNPIDDEITVSKTNDSNGDSVVVAELLKVTDVDVKWGLPKNQYSAFIPLYTTMNQFVSFKAPCVVPRVPYKLRITFAPETRFEQTDSTANLFLSTLVRLTLDGNKFLRNPANTNGTYEVSGTDVTTIEVDSCISESGLGAAEIMIETRVSAVQLRKGTYNRILRISEVRFIPYKNEEN